MDTNESLFIYSTAPSKEVAEHLAETLLKQYLVAGVSILPKAQSMYHWQGEIVRHEECLLFMHSTKMKWPAIKALIKNIHPYITPCLIALPISDGHPDFMAWIHTSTTPPSEIL